MKLTGIECAPTLPVSGGATVKQQPALVPDRPALPVRTATEDLASCARAAGPFRLLAGALLVGALVWAYWPALARVAQRWVSDPQYSHGYLVPAFAVVLLWLRRQQLADITPRFSLWGLPLLLAGSVMYLAGVYLYVDWLAQAALLPSLAGIAVILGGWPALRWSWPAIAFLVFMLPLPFRLETMLSQPLRRVCTVASTYMMQVVGIPAVSEGNVIIVDELHIGVVEACSGLGMLVVFCAMATGVVLVIQRPLLDRIILLLSAVPIAVLANMIRIGVTGILYELVGPKMADAFFHYPAGLLMPPLALGFLWFELWLLAHLLVEVPDSTKAAATMKPAVGTSPPKKNGKKGSTKPRLW